MVNGSVNAILLIIFEFGGFWKMDCKLAVMAVL